jgi:hypothetical protein
MKSRDQIERELARCILSAAQSEQDATGEFMCPAGTLADLLPSERQTVDVARRACGVMDRVWDAELRHHLLVREIVHGAASQHGRGARWLKTATF